jgi:dihydroorotate dehydrogenase electron transfer subunit
MNLFEVRIVQNRPVAKHQWALTVKLEEGDLPDFLPGQFCMLSLPDLVDPLLARPFAIVDRAEGTYQFIYRVFGKFTQLLVKAPQGSRLGLLGPLGSGIERTQFLKGRYIFVAGGTGYASLLPLISAAAQNKNPSRIFYGVREELEVIRRASLKCDFASDDGSIGFKGRLHLLLKEKEAELSDADSIFVCGPTPMMKAVHAVLPPEKTFYFLETPMGCGSGICMSCCVDILNEPMPVRSCVEGPVFKGSTLKMFLEKN